MKRSGFLRPIVLILCLAVLLLFPSLCIEGAKSGLLLWYQKVLPVLLPFFILSSLISHTLHASPLFTTLFLGYLCGYPMGAKCIRDYYIQGYFSKTTATRLLCVANHASPMFLIGYVCTMQLHGALKLSLLFFAIYWPPLLLSLIFWLRYAKKPSAPQALPPGNPSPYTLDESIEHSLLLILKIACYIMIYAILCNLILSIGAGIENHVSFPCSNLLLPFCAGLLEMTTGIATMAGVTAPSAVKIASIIAIASFGGCSSISQIASTIKGTKLSLVPYTLSKICYCVLSFFTIWFYLKFIQI